MTSDFFAAIRVPAPVEAGLIFNYFGFNEIGN
jgi:hypothetical protein